jgi:hypothetical protein
MKSIVNLYSEIQMLRKSKAFILVLVLLVLSSCTIKEIAYGTYNLPPEVVATPAPEQAQTFLRSFEQPNYKIGYDVLGLAKYCNEYLAAPRLPYVSTLMRTFGDPIPCLKQDIARGGKTDIQINLRDATCWRNKKCPPGTPSLTDWNDIKKLATIVNNQIAVPNPNIQVYISPYLEHDIKDPKVIQKACAVSLAACKSCKCVNEPFSGTKTTGFELELHGTKKIDAEWASGDGASMFDGDNRKNDGNQFQHRKAGKKGTAGWWNSLNLRCQGEKTFTPIEKRTERPSGDEFRQAYQTLMYEEPPVPAAPALCKSVREVDGSKGEIYKPNAEDYCNGQEGENDPRGDRPLLIIRKGGSRGDKVKVYSSLGREVGCFKYYGTFTTPGTHRWYVGDCSGQKPFALYKNLGNEWGFVALGGGQCLRFNVLRRMGIYR